VEKKIAIVTDPSFVAGCKALAKQLRANTLSNLAPQVVHHDYRAANILWWKGRITAVLDFEELSWGYRVNDLAWAAVHLGTRFHHWGPVSAEIQAAFCAGYASICSLTEAEQAWLPPLITWHNINLASQQQVN
jgi:homoserine kinase type II